MRGVERVRSISELRGLWQRSLIEWPDGTTDATTRVRWLQGPCAYADLRQPVPMPEFSGIRGIAHLSRSNCMGLASQEGFAGRLLFDGVWFEWQRSIDFQPNSLRADAGSLCWQADVLIERGRDLAYVEQWHRVGRLPTQPACAVALSHGGSPTRSMLVRVGLTFMFARERAVVPTAGRTLGACVADAASLEEAHSLIDCEVSFGEVGVHGFRITASTLPYRVGDTLDPRFNTDGLSMLDRAPDGEIIRRRWDITASDGLPDELLAPVSESCGG